MFSFFNCLIVLSSSFTPTGMILTFSPVKLITVFSTISLSFSAVPLPDEHTVIMVLFMKLPLLNKLSSYPLKFLREWYISSRGISKMLDFLTASKIIGVDTMSILLTCIPVLSVIVDSNIAKEPISTKSRTPFPSSISCTLTITVSNISLGLTSNGISTPHKLQFPSKLFTTLTILLAVELP
ncbi:hypothetical protein D3C81_659150 [compost metagenome]